MPDRRTHRKVGRVAGAVYDAHRAKNQEVSHFIAESIGGAIGGEVGAMAADWLELHVLAAPNNERAFRLPDFVTDSVFRLTKRIISSAQFGVPVLTKTSTFACT